MSEVNASEGESHLSLRQYSPSSGDRKMTCLDRLLLARGWISGIEDEEDACPYPPCRSTAWLAGRPRSDKPRFSLTALGIFLFALG